MKKINLFLLIALSVTAIASCGNNGGNEESGETDSSQEVIGHDDKDIKRYTFSGTHEFNYSETDYFIVRNKLTDYKVVLPHETDSYLIKAKEELISLFKEATGATLESINEDEVGLTHSSSNLFISIGDTNLFATSGLSIDKKAIGMQGARILTKDKTIFLNGGDNHGCIYAVYDLLEILFNFDAFSYDCIHVDKKDNVKFYNIDVTDIPDIAKRANSWGFIKENPNNIAYRLRTPFDFGDYILLVGDTAHGQNRAAIHSCLDIIPKRVDPKYDYIYDDPNEWDAKWFSDRGDQICYTAHGDSASRERLLNKAARIIEEGLVAYTPKAYPLRNIVTFTMEDNHDICSCEACRAQKEKYLEEAGVVIVFCNDLMAKVREWMDKPENAEYKRDNLKLLFFAYNEYVTAPAHFDEASDKYVVNHPDLVMRDDVGVYFAVSSGWQYQLPIYDERNKGGNENYFMWCDISSSMNLWTYNANFGSYLSHVNSTNFYSPEAYQLFAHGGCEFLYNQGGWNTYNLTAYQMLAIYLDAKLSWNSNYDMNALIDKWFDNMYKNAAKEMKQLFYEENTYSIILFDKIGKLQSTGIINVNLGGSQDYWPYQMLMSWLDLTEKAREKISIYASVDFDTYAMLNEHINLEWLSPAYYMLSVYGADYMPVEMYEEYKNRMINEILPLKYFLVSERSASISSWILSL